MNTNPPAVTAAATLPAGYLAAMAEIERRALRGELTLVQVRQEVFTARERFAVEPSMAARWAAGSP